MALATTFQAYDLIETELPDVLTEGLQPHQQKSLSEAVHKINLGFGCVIKDTARILKRLKEDIPHGHFTKFIKSNLIPVSERGCRDLLAAHDWLMETCVSDEVLAQLGYRVLRSISVAKPAVQMDVEELLKKGQVVTQKMVEEKDGKRSLRKVVNDEVKMYSVVFVKGLQDRELELVEENEKLKSEVEELKVRLESLAVATSS